MANDIIAVVAGKEITEEDFNTFMKTLPAEQQAYLQNPEAVKYFKEQFVNLYLFETLGREEKLNETEEFQKMIQKTEREILSQMVIQNILGDIEVSDSEAEIYYNENKESFKKNESAQAKHILMDSEEKLLNVKKEIEDGTITFEDAAVKHSSCPSGQKGGDLGEFGRGQMVKEFEDATFSAEIGKIVGPVKTQFGYHLIKVEKRTDAQVAPFEEVKETVKRTLLQKKQQEVYDAKVAELKKKYCK